VSQGDNVGRVTPASGLALKRCELARSGEEDTGGRVTGRLSAAKADFGRGGCGGPLVRWLKRLSALTDLF
jgi:hypothetical protein